MRVQSPTGGSFEFSFETYKRIGDIGMYARMAGEPQDATTAMLSTEVMEQRPLSLSRIIEQPSGELPQLLELKAQIEELYGPPSKSEIDSYSMTLTYGWGEAGFIADLDAQEPMSFEVPRAGQTRFIDDYRPCLGHSAVDSRITHDFRHPRERDLMPGCVAVYWVRFTGEAGRTRIEFGLSDFELGRMHREELDRQIMARIDGTTATPSDLDL